MIYYNLKFLDNLNKVKTVKHDASVIQNSLLLILSFNKLFFSKTDLTTVE